MKYASISIRFKTLILDELWMLLTISALSLDTPDACRFAIVNGSTDCVVFIRGESKTLKRVYMLLNRYFLSEEAMKWFMNNQDEELLTVRVYNPQGNLVNNKAWAVSRSYIHLIANEP